MNITSVTITSDDGTATEVALARGSTGWFARRDGHLIYVSAVASSRPPAMTPAKWAALP
jgi:hypothetical protein